MTNLISKSFIAALGFLLAMAISPMTQASENPFGMTKAADQQMHVAENEGKCGDGKAKKAEGKCGNGKAEGMTNGKAEGKCGDGKGKDTGKSEEKKEEKADK